MNHTSQPHLNKMYTFIPISPTKEAWLNRPFVSCTSLKDMIDKLQKIEGLSLRGQIVLYGKEENLKTFSGLKELESQLIARNWSDASYSKIHFYQYGSVLMNHKN